MHLPELPLISGARTCLGGFECLLVKAERKIKEDVPYFTCINIFLFYLFYRLTDVS